MKNVGWIDRSMRTALGIFLVWLGLFHLEGIDGNQTGIVVVLLSGLPFYVAFSSFCPVFTWFKFSTLSNKEKEEFGSPYSKD